MTILKYSKYSKNKCNNIIYHNNKYNKIKFKIKSNKIKNNKGLDLKKLVVI